ncbi:hypothetical protein DPMN_191404 [Dreissena polymorpha]|uniref:Uncharacterized protein n=1 Tax=Dreissena polymorpha TaxID=45954 RepID=A0A9D3Y500_DREPO|nr:hypothetical protein DPMN_191404 [Dreissena polymorpha]
MFLDNTASASRTSKLWVDCLIKAVFLIMMYVRAKREGDLPLHLTSVKLMLPYFFAAAHPNYARFFLYYLRSPEKMSESAQEKFLKGEHVMRHVPGVWNAAGSDMFIETTFMRYGHGKKKIIGSTLQP